MLREPGTLSHTKITNVFYSRFATNAPDPGRSSAGEVNCCTEQLGGRAAFQSACQSDQPLEQNSGKTSAAPATSRRCTRWPWPDVVQSLLPSGPRLRRIVPRASGATFAATPLARLRSYRSRGVARMDLGVPPRAPAATRAGPHIARQNRRRRLSEQAIPSA